MALRTPYANDAKQYDFGYLRHFAETLLNSEGVANYATDMVVTNAATGLKVDIAAGAAWVKGDSGTPAMGLSQGLFSVVNDAAVSNAVTLPAAHATNPRLDQIVLKVRDSADLGSGADDAIFDYVQGTPTAGATLLNRNGAAALPNDCLRLADVLVPAAATNLVAANIRDRRIPASGRGTRHTAAVDTTPGTSYGELTVPDIVEVYVPPDAVVRFRGRAFTKNSAAAQYMTFYIIDYSTTTPVATQLKTQSQPAPLALDFNVGTNSFYGLLGTSSSVPASGADLTEVSTGVYDASPLDLYGLPGGTTYGFSMRFKAASGTTSVKERRVTIEVIGNGRSQ